MRFGNTFFWGDGFIRRLTPIFADDGRRRADYPKRIKPFGSIQNIAQVGWLAVQCVRD